MHPPVVDQTFEGVLQRREILALPPGKKMSVVEAASQKKSSVARLSTQFAPLSLVGPGGFERAWKATCALRVATPTKKLI